MKPFEVSVRKEQGFAVVISQGYINNLGGEKIGETCRALITDGFRSFVLNLAGSPVVNSIGISILIEIIEKVLELQGRIAFCHLTPTVGKTFKIMGLLQYAENFTSEADAVRAFASAAEPAR